MTWAVAILSLLCGVLLVSWLDERWYRRFYEKMYLSEQRLVARLLGIRPKFRVIRGGRK